VNNVDFRMHGATIKIRKKMLNVLECGAVGQRSVGQCVKNEVLH
jgi:hypothetical protein